MQEYLRRILTAKVYDVATETPLDLMPRLAGRLGRDVMLKREDLQPVFSFKIRGAYNKMANLSAEALRRGVVCASAGNHAQGVAYAARRLGCAATVAMPSTTPGIKVRAVESLGAAVVLHGDTFDQACDRARELERARGLTFVHPYDDPDVIAGQGTIGLEIMRQHPGPIAAVFLPVGGGGLAAGVTAYLKALTPEIRVVGVEPEDAASMRAAIRTGERVVLNEVGLFADGVAVAQAGAEPFRVCKDLLDGVLTVTVDEICAAVKDIFEDTRAVAEPAGAVSLAGLKKYAAAHAGDDNGAAGTGALIAVNSGANLNFDRLRHIAERAVIGETREALLAVTIPERPGAYLAFIGTLGARSVTEFNYRYAGPGEARIFVGVELRGGNAEKAEIVAALTSAGYAVVDMTGNEMAKLHVRYMVGGRAPGLPDELLYRFLFPERPGALARFLGGMTGGWNISLFHYRNHGSAYGRVLAGIQVPETDRPQFQQYLETLGYPHWDETENPAYKMFL